MNVLTIPTSEIETATKIDLEEQHEELAIGKLKELSDEYTRRNDRKTSAIDDNEDSKDSV